MTPRVRELADRLTAGVDDRREQALRLYEHVVRNVRYEALALGSGRVVPQTPDTILATGYGDCKDHALLLAALSAKGIATEQALINGGLDFALDGPPSLVALNHVADYVPELDLYLDTRAGALRPAAATALRQARGPGRGERQPAGARAAARDRRQHRDFPLGRAPRRRRHDLGRAHRGGDGPERRLAAHGDRADRPRARPGGARPAGVPQRGRRGHRLVRVRFPLPARRRPLRRPHDVPLRPALRRLPARCAHHRAPRPLHPGPAGLDAGRHPRQAARDGSRGRCQALPCRAGRHAEEIVLEAPEGYHVERVPAGTQLDTPLASFSSGYEASGRTLTVRRELVSKVPHGTCSAEEQDALRPLVSALRTDLRQRVTVAADARDDGSRAVGLPAHIGGPHQRASMPTVASSNGDVPTPLIRKARETDLAAVLAMVGQLARQPATSRAPAWPASNGTSSARSLG